MLLTKVLLIKKACTCRLAFSSLPLWIPGENKVKLKKLFNLNSRLTWGAQYVRYTECNYYFLSAIAVIHVTSWTEDNLCYISDCRNSFNYNLKKVISELKFIFYSLCLSDKSIDIKHFKRHTFIGSLLIPLNLQILSLC